ncbi:MAG: hypothetical protein ACI8XV_003144, partial [Arenicella sp.]
SRGYAWAAKSVVVSWGVVKGGAKTVLR